VFFFAGVRDFRGAELRRKEYGTLPSRGPLVTIAGVLFYGYLERPLLRFRIPDAVGVYIEYRNH
jgi:hypothetical protein